tara:strand:+ start:13259 stop:13537 length:279 start_codon:yes stop_codon:yes gene_type:complete
VKNTTAITSLFYFKNKDMTNIIDGDFSVRLMNCAKRLKVTTIEQLRTRLELSSEVYIPGSLLSGRQAQFFNKKKILEELDSYQENILDRDPD